MIATTANVLAMVTDEYELIGIPPSVRQVQAHFGWASPATAHYHLRKLLAAGLVRRERGMYVPVSRMTIRVLQLKDGTFSVERVVDA